MRSLRRQPGCLLGRHHDLPRAVAFGVPTCSDQTLRQWIKRGLLPPAKIVSDGNGVESR